MTQSVAQSKTSPFAPVPRIHVDDLAANDVAHLFGGATPLIVEGLDGHWPEAYRGRGVDAFARFDRPINSVYVAGRQVFGVSDADFVARVTAGENVRVFGARLAPDVVDACSRPAWLYDRLQAHGVFRNNDDRPHSFIGAGKAITPLHYDLEVNLIWHLALAGERQVYLWTQDQSPNLFKLPVLGISPIPFARGRLGYRFAQGYATTLKPGELLYMPAGCWHQVEYSGAPSAAMTYGLHATREDQAEGVARGNFWRGFISFTQGIGRGRWRAWAALPLMLPLAWYAGLYIAVNFLSARTPNVVGRPVRRAVEALDRRVFRLYAPLMKYFRRRLWIGL